MYKFIIATLLMLIFCKTYAATVRFETNLGNIDIELYDEETPVTVQNFLNYVNDGDYDGTVIHRTDPFNVGIIQGGAYRYNGNGNFETVATNSPIVNEASISNAVGTISMARASSPNSARNQWFFNLKDNPGLNQNGNNAGYAVFGEVVKGIEVIKIIGSLLRVDLSSNISDATNEFPLYQYSGGNVVGVDNVVKIIRAYQLSEQFQMTAGVSGAYFNPATDGQGIYLEVLPSISQVIMAWFTYDTTVPDDLTPSEVSYAGGRWLTAVGNFQGNVFTGTIYETSGGLFENGAPITNTPVGTVTLTFNSCSQVVMNYSIYGATLNGMNNLQRISGANVAMCEQMANEANQGN